MRVLFDIRNLQISNFLNFIVFQAARSVLQRANGVQQDHFTCWIILCTKDPKWGRNSLWEQNKV